MNKLYLLILLAFPAFLLQAQTEKGTFMLGGSLSYHYHHQENPDGTEHKDFSTFIYPAAGYFLKNNLSLNISILYGTAKTYHIKNGHHHTTTSAYNYGIAPFLRYYFLMGEKAAFHLSLHTQYDRGGSKLNDEKGGTYFNISGGLRPGFSLFITEKFALEAQAGLLGYVYGENYFEGKKTYHRNFYARIAPANMNFGAFFYF